MKLVYPTSVENLRAFARFNKRSRLPEMRKRQRALRKTPLLVAVLLTFASPVLTIAGGLHMMLHDHLIGFLPLFFGAFFLLIVGWQLLPHVRRRNREKKWLEYPHLGRLVTVEVNDAGFHYREETIERHVEWSAVTDVDESPTHIFLIDSQPMVYIVPKGAFASSADAEAFRDRLMALQKSA